MAAIAKFNVSKFATIIAGSGAKSAAVISMADLF
jgi:hypothetical protein